MKNNGTSNQYKLTTILTVLLIPDGYSKDMLLKMEMTKKGVTNIPYFMT